MRIAAGALTVLLVASCSTYRSLTVEEQRALLIQLEEDTLAELLEGRPEVQDELNSSVGYAVFTSTMTKVPVVGAGEGIGMAVDARGGERTYLRVGRLDIGGGLGARSIRLVMFFFDEAAFSKLTRGRLELGAGAEVVAGSGDVGAGAVGIASSRKKGHVVYQLSEAGVAATVTVRLVRYSVLRLDG